MPKREYEWSDINDPPVIARHSLNKHEVLKNYFERYLDKLYAKPRDYLRFSIVDGFAGGGIYRRADTGELHYGSPVILMKTVDEMAAVLEDKYKKSLEFRPRYYFVERNKKYLNTLRSVLQSLHLDPVVDGKGGLIQGQFQKVLPKIVDEIKSEGKTHKVLLLLDQYGYADVPRITLNYIFSSLPQSEVILTFAVDWLLDYLSTKPELIESCKKRLESLGVDMSVEEIVETRESSSYGRFLIQELLSEELCSSCGAKYYTRYFIQTENSKGKQSHRSFWLVHMSQHPTARDEMVKVHWEAANHISTHAGAVGIDDRGLTALGYSTHQDDRFGQYSFEYNFDDHAEKLSIESLLKILPTILWDRKSITFGELMREIANYSPISSEILKKVVNELLVNKDVVVTNVNGGLRIKGNSIHWDDIISTHSRSMFGY